MEVILQYIALFTGWLAALFGVKLLQRLDPESQARPVGPQEPAREIITSTTTDVAPQPPMPPQKTKMEELYEIAKALRGKHLSLDESIPWGVGCAQAVSKVLKIFGTSGIPVKGYSGTATLYTFLMSSPSFRLAAGPAAGRIIINVTGTGNGKIRGHVGICGKHSIMSNNSENGLWTDHWTIDRWLKYYEGYGDIPTLYFEPI